MNNKRLNRVINRVIFTEEEWSNLTIDIQNKEPKTFICAKYNIKSGDYKIIKRKIINV